MQIISPTRSFSWAAILLILYFMIAAFPTTAPADDLRDLVEEVLDQTAQNITIMSLPIRQALVQLGEQTGLRFMLDESAVAWMPYGERTRVSIAIDGITYRQGLRQMFDGLGLGISVVGDKIRIEPAPVLDRLGRRLNIHEMHLLQKLALRQWSELDDETRTVQFRGLTDPDLTEMLERAIAQVRAPNALYQLEAATQSLGWHWVPDDQSIVIYSQTEDVWYRLERKIDLNYQGAPLDDVLIDLGQRVGVTVLFEAGVLDRIQANQRAVDLIHRDTTPFQTLERICGATGTCFEVQDYGVLIGTPTGPGPMRRSTEARIVAILRVPVDDDGTSVEFPFYEDDLPLEFRNLLERKLPVVIEELQRREGE